MTNTANSTFAHQINYSVAQHLADMDEANAPYRAIGGALWHSVEDVDWTLYDKAKAKAKLAGITIRAIFAHLNERNS